MIQGNFGNDHDDPEEEGIKKAAPSLLNQEKKNPFSVPEDYFDSLPSIVQDRIQKQSKAPWIEIILKALLRPQVAIAMLALLLLIFRGIYYFRSQVKQTIPLELAASDDELKNAYILSTMDETTIIDELTASNEVTDNPQSTETEIENYIIDNHTDINQIINEL